ncbi:MAG: GNAT family N-acetyltransferase [Planctomycetes bacterium]|nr:GNAT family N-acetyltransferase [Planctomycetota bacterium]
MAEQPVIRRLSDRDSLVELTELLHRSYKRLADMGFNYTATDQSIEKTQQRVQGNECFVAVVGGRIVGTALLIPHQLDTPQWANRPGVCYAGQLGVDPEFRHLGLGAKLMNTIVDRARELGFKEIGGDTSEGADYLIKFYTGLGWKIVGHTQWENKTYRSVILAKQL